MVSKDNPEWKSQVEDLWLWDKYPERWGPDCGIDLLESIDGWQWDVSS